MKTLRTTSKGTNTWGIECLTPTHRLCRHDDLVDTRHRSFKGIERMTRALLRVVTFFTFVTTASAYADDIPRIEAYSSPEDFKLSEECQVNQLMVNYCASAAEQFYTMKLESLYQQLEQNDELENAKSSWNNFAAKECARFAKPFEMGSIYPTVVNDCLQALTKQRIRNLTRELSCNRDGGCSYPE